MKDETQFTSEKLELCMLCPFFRFILKRIQEQRDYIKSIKSSNYPPEMKLELVTTAKEVKTKLQIQLANRHNDLTSIPAEHVQLILNFNQDI